MEKPKITSLAEAFAAALDGTGAFLMKPDGDMAAFPPPANMAQGYTLEELRPAIGGGYIEIVTVERDRIRMIVDDEGLIKDLPVNEHASLVYQVACGGRAQTPIAGPAVLVPWDWIK